MEAERLAILTYCGAVVFCRGTKLEGNVLISVQNMILFPFAFLFCPAPPPPKKIYIYLYLYYIYI